MTLEFSTQVASSVYPSRCGSELSARYARRIESLDSENRGQREHSQARR